ncbi:MAG TPA: hypothetical protein VNW94_03060 [Streptosporangiaceae bacterium]|nr:hypothetical protein [Streptosporangiaceae bacterium]
MNRRDRRRSARDSGLRRVGKLTKVTVAAALAGTGLLAAGFGHALHVPNLSVGTGGEQSGQSPAGGGSSLQGPDQPPSQPQAPPVSVSGGS